MNTNQFLKDLSAKWCAKWPGHQDRIERGLEIALAKKVAPLELDSFRVAGSEEYTVKVNFGFPCCTCPDFGKGGYRCKHIWACSLMARLAAEIEEQAQKLLQQERDELGALSEPTSQADSTF